MNTRLRTSFLPTAADERASASVRFARRTQDVTAGPESVVVGTTVERPLLGIGIVDVMLVEVVGRRVLVSSADVMEVILEGSSVVTGVMGETELADSDVVGVTGLSVAEVMGVDVLSEAEVIGVAVDPVAEVIGVTVLSVTEVILSAADVMGVTVLSGSTVEFASTVGRITGS